MTQVVLLTKHNKAQWIAPPLQNAGLQVVEYSHFDTDSLGTFCHTRQREQDAQQTAEKKARLACELSGARFGLGSEGSFSQQVMPGLTWEQEIICYFDSALEKALFGISEGAAEMVAFEALSAEDIEDIGKHAHEQKWMWQTPDGDWQKGLSHQQLNQTIQQFETSYPTKVVPDYRAMHCPGRQSLIAEAAKNLALRLTSCCPRCNANNFVYEKISRGLPCEVCSLPTQQAKGWWAECESCGYTDFSAVEAKTATVTYCAFCNP